MKRRAAKQSRGSGAARADRSSAGGLKVVVGVCGSIAAYKACELVRQLIKGGADVRVVMTVAAGKFVTPLTLSVVSRNPVASDLYDTSQWDMAHLSLAGWAEKIVVAPATADFMARAAQGRAGSLLEALLLSSTGLVALCPAMDAEMWAHRATKENVRRLQSYGYRIWGPAQGELASGKLGWGRLLEPEEIASRILAGQ